MKKGFVIVFLVLFSFLLSAQSVEQICIGVNEYAKNLRSAYYEADIIIEENGQTTTYFNKVSFQKNKYGNKIFAKINAQIYSSNELIQQVFCDNKRFTLIDSYENIAEQYDKEDYEEFIKQIDVNVIPEFVFNKPIFNLKAIEKGEILVERKEDTIINGFEMFRILETLMKFDTLSYIKEHYIRKSDFLPIAKNTTINYLNQEKAIVKSKSYQVMLSRIDENTAYHEARFEFDFRNSAIDLRYKSRKSLNRQWIEQERNQSTFAYGSEALDFKVEDVFSKPFELKANKGKVVIMAFFYNSCSPCVPVLNDLQKIYEKYKEEGVEVIALNPVDSKLGEEEMQSFVQEHNITYHVAQIPRNSVEEMYLVRYFPTIFIIDKKGRVVYSHQGYNTLFKDKISDIIDKEL